MLAEPDLRRASPFRLGGPARNVECRPVARTYAGKGKHHLDRRADRIAEEGDGNDDDLLTSRELADWLGLTADWVELGRSKNYGPKFIRLASRVVRYRRGDVIAWLRERARAS
jgi:predicted DNA-binding transcriptional regulator AlpA